MSRRKTVSLDLPYALSKIKEKCRSNVVFAERMERSGKWVSDWKRNKNLPSPEEAARMCVILQVRPEEILTEPEDIKLVTSLLESQKKPTIQEDDGHIPSLEELSSYADRLTTEQLGKVMAIYVQKYIDRGGTSQ